MNKRYTPPIPWERLDAMMMALSRCQYKGQVIDPATAAALLDALGKLTAIYQLELRATQPRKKPSDANLRVAAVAHQLVRFFDAGPADAMIAAGGNPRKVQRDSLAAEYRRLCPHLQGDQHFPEWAAILEAKARLDAKGTDK